MAYTCKQCGKNYSYSDIGSNVHFCSGLCDGDLMGKQYGDSKAVIAQEEATRFREALEEIASSHEYMCQGGDLCTCNASIANEALNPYKS